MRKYIRRRAEPRHALTLRVRCLRKVRLHDDEIAAGHAHKLVNDALFHTTIRLDSMHRDDATATVAGHRNVVQIGREKRIADTQRRQIRSEEHTSELQSLLRNSYAVF